MKRVLAFTLLLLTGAPAASQQTGSVPLTDLLEKRYARPGLNLSDPVREGILKTGLPDEPPPEEFAGIKIGRPSHFEGQVVRQADRISSALSELDDALQVARWLEADGSLDALQLTGGHTTKTPMYVAPRHKLWAQ